MSEPLLVVTALVLPVFFGLSGCREPNSNTLQAQTAIAEVAGGQAAENNSAQAPASDAKYQPVTLCNIEYINAAPFGNEPSTVNTPLVVRGWLGSESGLLEYPQLLVADGNNSVVAQYPLQLNMDRPDVVQAYPGRAGLERSGFEVKVGLDGLGGQAYHLYLVYNSGSGRFACDNGRQIMLSR